MSSQAPALQLTGLTKYYGQHRGIEDVSLEVERGQVIGFLGPNGAGKTTAIRTLLGFLRPTAGGANILGLDVVSQTVAVRRRVGYVPGDPSLYGNRNGRELLAFALRARGADGPEAERLIEVLDAPMDRDVKKLSRGMRQKVALVVALAHDPELIILDEPTSGLDPLGQRALLQYLDERAEAGRTVVLSSHVLSEVEQVCDRVAILREGRLATVQSVEGLREQKYREVTIAFTGAAPTLAGAGEVEVVWEHETRLTVRVRGEAHALLTALAAAPNVTDVSITEPSLEDVFLDYYREEARRMRTLAVDLFARSWVALGWWLFGTIAMLVYVVAVYDSIGNIQDLQRLYDQYPQSIKDLIGNVNIGELDGWIHVEFLSWLPLILGIYGGIFAGGNISKEAEQRTVDFVLGLPVSRTQFIGSRLIVGLTNLALLCGSVFVVLTLEVKVVGHTPHAGRYALALFNAYLLGAALFTAYALIATFVDEQARIIGITIGATLVIYIATAALKTAGAPAYIRWLSPFEQFHSDDVMSGRALPVGSLIVLAAGAVIAAAGAVWWYNRRDLAV